MLPRWALPLVFLLGVVGLIPFALVAKARVSTTDQPRIHVVRDMDNQERFKAQQENALFADKRAMRAPVPGTVARGELRLDDHFERGRVGEGWATAFPAQVLVDGALPREFVLRGRERFEIYCAPCHGLSGHGDGMVHQRVQLRKLQGVKGMGGWAAPSSYHSDQLRNQPLGYLFHVASDGVRNMAGYRNQIPTRDRWAIVAYVRALQFSQQ